MSNPPPHPLDAESLLRADAFVRRLARTLVADAATAEDLAQQTWLAALERPPDPEVPFRGWLTTVVRRLAARLRRGSARRIARESVAARSEIVASDAGYQERERLRRAVVDAVFSLEEPYRTTLLLRFLDDLPPRRISERMSVPVETVRTRVKRGLELIRTRLDGTQRDAADPRRAWVALLAPLGRGRDSWIATAIGSLSIGGLLVTAKTKVVLGAGAVAIAVAISLIALGDGWRKRPPTTDARDAMYASSRTGESQEQADFDVAAPTRIAESTPVPTPEALSPLLDSFGGLDVRVVIEHGAPLEGVGVFLEDPASKAATGGARFGFTGSDGFCSFAEVPVGPVTAFSERARGGRAVVRANVRTELILKHDERADDWVVDVKGRVEHDGEPVEGATIRVVPRHSVMFPPFEPRPVATSDREGRFSLEAIPSGWLIGATADGFGPSPCIEARVRRGERDLELRLALGDHAGAVAGRVVDESGIGVAGARVLIGDDRRWMLEFEEDPISGSAAHPRLSQVAFTDHDGRFSAGDLHPGSETILVRAGGHAPWNGSVEIRDGETSRCDVTLARGARVEGFVRDGKGEPVQGAEITAGPPYRFTSTSTKSREDGSFRIDGLASGFVRIEVVVRDRGRSIGELDLAAGETRRWDAVLDAGGTIRGSVRAESGDPLSRWHVEARGVFDDRVESEHLSTGDTDLNGSFTLGALPASRYTLKFSDSDGNVVAAATRRDVRPDGALLEVVVADSERANARLAGSFRGPTGETVGAIELYVGTAGGSGSRRHDVDRMSGVFDLGPLPPGLYYFRAEARGYPTLERSNVLLEPNRRTDLGELRFERGAALRIALSGEGIDLAGATVEMNGRGGFNTTSKPVNGVARFEGLPSGQGYVFVHGPGIAAQSFEIELTDGATLERSVALVPGVPVILRFHSPSSPVPANWIPGAQIQVAGSNFKLLGISLPDIEKKECEWKVRLAPGDYTIEVYPPQFEQPLVIRADDPRDRVVEVELP